MNHGKKKGQDGFLKSAFAEIRDSLLGELFVNILFFIPRVLIRIIKNLF